VSADRARLTWWDIARDIGLGIADAAVFPTGALALARVPHGDGHQVLVLPGFLAGDATTAPLRWFLAQIGYGVHPWTLGINYGLSTSYHYDIEALLEHRIKEVVVESGQRRVSLIGWSLGGVYAKHLARRHPGLVRDVITLGSPLSGDSGTVSVRHVYERVSGMDFADPAFASKLRELNRPLAGVPVTAFYCRRDGVVPWRNARERPGAMVQNIEVTASHSGMGFDAWVFYLIAHRLAQSMAGAWRALNLAALRRRFRRERLPF